MNAEAGSQTPLPAFAASVLLAVVLIVIGSDITLTSKPAMVSLILCVAWGLIDARDIRHIITSSKPETLILLLALAASLLPELGFANYVGEISSFAVFS